MTVISVVYHSGTGHTRIMADAVAKGAASAEGAEAQVFEIVGADIAEGRWDNAGVLEALDACDAIIFGSPTYMGCVSAQMKAFLDATLQRFYSRAWADKVAAGFTISATPSGDKTHALTTMAVCAMQLGMIWVGQERTPLNAEAVNRLAIFMGAGGQAEFGKEEPSIHAGDEATGEALGRRVAEIARKLAADAK